MDVTSGTCRGWSSGAWILVRITVLSCLLAKSFAADADSRIKFNIPAGTLGETLREFISQAQIEAMYVSTLDGRTVATVTTRAVNGRFTPAEALARMLEGTGVTFEFEHALSVLLRPPPRRATAVNTVGPPEEASFAAAREAVEAEPLQQVVVTGSLIRGLEDITAPLMILGQKEKKQAAYGTVQDVLRTLPQNFGGGVSEDYSFNQNFNRGFGINLRGLGTGATLVLVNGRRQPASGIAGDFVDVSTIPWSAVERIDVLTDGSSALYGSDAIAGVVNIVMREDLDGAAETQTRLGSALGGADETLLAQSFGHNWAGGKWMFTYQYSERGALAAGDRNYAADADKRLLGGSDLRSLFGNPGNILDPVTQRPAFAIPDGQDGRSLEPDQLLPGVTNFYNQMAQKDLLPDSEAHSVFVTASQALGARLNLFAEGRYGQRRIWAAERAHTQVLAVPSTHPFFVDPFGGSPFVLIAYNFLNEFGPIYGTGETTTYTGTLGVRISSDEWQATLLGNYGKESMHWKGHNVIDSLALSMALADPNPATTFNPFGSGSSTSPATLDAIRYTQLERAAADIRTISLVADGPLPDLPAGTPKLAIGFDHRSESLLRYDNRIRDDKLPALFERKTTAGFAELSLPLLSRLNLLLASRYERYDDFGDTFNQKIGLRWEVNDSLRFRGSWGSSFRAPTLADLYDRSLDAAVLFPLADPHSMSGFSLILLEQGRGPDLHEETAKTWTAGVDFAPMFIPGLTWASTFYAIQYDNQVWRYRPPLTLGSLLTEDKWAVLVTRNPSRTEVERICRSPVFLGSPEDCLVSTPTAILDLRLRNLSSTSVKGVDMELKQTLRTDAGSFSFALDGSYVLSFEQSLTPAAPAIDVVGNVLNPPTLRLRGTAQWHQRGLNQSGWGTILSAHYVSRFQDENSTRVPQVTAATTFDAQVSYRTVQNDAWFGGLDLTLNVVNVFNQDPPFIDQEQGYDPTNVKPYGRVISLSVRKAW